MIADEQLGVPLDEALARDRKRMENRDLVQVALVAMLQREAGGNAADVLDQVSENIRARLELRRLVSGSPPRGVARWIVVAAPRSSLFLASCLNNELPRPLWTETDRAVAALIVGDRSWSSPALRHQRIVDIEV